ncbi:hypothetical protein QTN25_001682 [Entamoeba marina]
MKIKCPVEKSFLTTLDLLRFSLMCSVLSTLEMRRFAHPPNFTQDITERLITVELQPAQVFVKKSYNKIVVPSRPSIYSLEE